MKSIDQCADKHREKGEAGRVVACLPFSSPLKTSGIWVVGFEKNDFFEAVTHHRLKSCGIREPALNSSSTKSYFARRPMFKHIRFRSWVVALSARWG